MHKTRDDLVAYLNTALLAANESMRSASIKLGLNHAYLSQFMKKTGYSPEVLPEDIRHNLSNLLGVDEKNLRVAVQTGLLLTGDKGTEPHSAHADVKEGRNTVMRIDHLFEEIGRLKERMDRLEAQEHKAPKRKPSSRPR